MEGTTSIDFAGKILGTNMIGPEALLSCSAIKDFLDLRKLEKDIPVIPYSEALLETVSETHLLILTVPEYIDGQSLNLLNMKQHFGSVSSSGTAPCFYNQDWYNNERFAVDTVLPYNWSLVRKTINNETRAQNPEDIINQGFSFPSAILCAYTFFVCFLVNGSVLWENEFLWCSDLDSNGDRIYVGRYKDPAGIAKDGFSIHRHLKLRNHYGAISVL